MTLIGQVFPKLLTAKDLVRWVSKNARLRRPFQKQHAKWSQTLPKSAQQPLLHIFWSIWMKISSWMSFWVIDKILELLVNILTAYDQYSLLNRENLAQPIKMQLSNQKKKKKLFLNFLLHFWKLDQIQHILKKQMRFRGYIFSELQTAKDVVR